MIIPGIPGFGHPVQPVPVRMKIIKTCFMPDKKENEKNSGDSDGESGNIDQGIEFIPEDITQSQLKE